MVKLMIHKLFKYEYHSFSTISFIDTKVNKDTFNACAKAGGGTVEFPSGNYLTFPFEFTGSNTVLNVEGGATILVCKVNQ